MRLATPSLSALLLLFVCAGARAQQTMQMVWNFPTSAPCNAPALWHDELAGPDAISAARTAQLEAFKGSWAELSTWVYVACSDGTLSSLNTTTSQVGWSTQLGTGSIVTDPALSNDGYIYVGTASGNVFKVDTLDGSVQWNQTLGTGIAQQSAISLGGNGLVVGIENGHTLFLSLADGSVVSTATGSTIANPTPIIYNGLVAHSDAGQVWVDTSSALTLLYKYIHGTGNFHRVLGLGKNFYAPNDGGTIYVFDAQSGATVRKIQCTTTKPLLYSQGNVVAVTTDGSAVAFSEATGGLSWTAPSNTYTSPAVVSANVPAIGLLYVGTSAGVSALNATDGSVVATFATNTPVTRPPGVQYGVGDVYLSTQRGIYRLRPPTV